jgi:hypothetical protein
MEGKHDCIDMGGMFTVVKVRENLTSYDDPGWYDNPPGTLASLAGPTSRSRHKKLFSRRKSLIFR